MTVRIICGDALTELRKLPDESAYCCVTSPPYWGLRDYGVDGQIGLEADFRDYIATMVAVFGDVRRVLRQDGTLWLNLGDSYCNSDKWGGGGANTGKHTRKPDGNIASWEAVRRKWSGCGLKPKDLCGIPWRLALALQEDGWWLRSDIIWSKPNPMPESVTDRPTKAHEYLFLLTKAERYYYDAEAIKEQAETDDLRRPYGSEGSWALDGRDPEKRPNGRLRSIGAKGNANTFRGGSYVGGEPGPRTEHGNVPNVTFSRNKRSVWTIATAPYSEAHFATFPPALIEPCILAGCPEGGTVLDPFGGAGTTGLVADRLGRNALLIEINPDYCAMAKRRIMGDAPLLTEVA